jgi:hypothetical protein
MGTRALTFVYEGDKPLVNLYRQYDGYPTGHGAELAQFLSEFHITNGISSGETRRTANGMGCLAAQVVAFFKESVGGFYIYSVDSVECGQDYEYHVYQKDKELRVRITNRGCNLFGLTMSDTNESLFDGSVSEFAKFCFDESYA